MSGPEADDEPGDTAVTSSSYQEAADDGQDCAFGFDACGAMDLSSCASSKAQEDTDDEDAEGEEEEVSSTASTDGGGALRARKRKESSGGGPRTTKRKRLEDSGGSGGLAAVSEESGEEEEEGEEARTEEEERSVKSLPPKIRNKRRNIKSVIGEERLEAETKAAKAEEAERLNRLAEQQKQLFLEVSWVCMDSVIRDPDYFAASGNLERIWIRAFLGCWQVATLQKNIFSPVKPFVTTNISASYRYIVITFLNQFFLHLGDVSSIMSDPDFLFCTDVSLLRQH
jgi:hypothetical protein